MKKVWKSIKLWFSIAFGKLKEVIKKNVEPAIKVVELLKQLAENPASDFLVALTPTKSDDIVLKHAKQLLPKVLLQLQFMKDFEGESNDIIIKKVIEQIRKLKGVEKHSFYLTLSSMLSTSLSDGEISWDEAVILVQFIYTEKFKK